MIKPVPILTISACLMLAGCGGGGGGGGGLTPVAFTSFAAVPKPGQVQLTGSSVEGDYASNSSFLVTSVTNQQTGSATVTSNYDAAGNQTAGTIAGSRSSVSFGPSDKAYNLSNIGLPGGRLMISSDGKTATAFASPNDIGNNYQTYGVWETGLNSGSGHFGAASVGAATSAGSVPTAGTANFSGNAIGAYIDAGGGNYVTASNATLAADFGARTVGFSTTNTQKYNANTYYSSSASNLNMSGSLSYAAGTNSFSGNVSTSGGMNGTASGRFYGPAATEIGGTFITKAATGVENFGGAFGAKR